MAMSQPSSLQRRVSPPPLKRKRTAESKIIEESRKSSKKRASSPSLAAIEAGEVVIEDHLDYFLKHLEKACRPVEANTPRLSIESFADLYRRNQHDNGRHFVVHQHNHPVAGIHYDLRLQFSSTSCVSWSIPYGLPGNPNSKRMGRMAVETRVHNLWNSLIESASHATGSLLIWDTGEYSILPWKKDATQTDDESTDCSNGQPINAQTSHSENAKLIEAFQTRHIRLRLHGTRLPKDYTILLRLPLANDCTAQPRAPVSHRRRKPWKPAAPSSAATTSSESDRAAEPDDDAAALTAASDSAAEAEEMRRTNAHAGAANTIGSVHQRRWYASLDRRSSGFALEGGSWVRRGARSGGDERGGFEPFFVTGVEHERSVVTGRLSAEVLADEGVVGFRPRGRWAPILE